MNKRKSTRRLHDFLSHLGRVFKGMRASQLTTDRIKAYILKRQHEGAANGTINRELGCLKRMFHLAQQHTPPKVARVPHFPMLEERNIRSGYFEHEDFLSLRGALPDYAQVAVTLAYYSGMRMGEVFSLQWQQVNWPDGKLYLQSQDTKTDTPRVLYLGGDLLRVLIAWKQRCDQKWPECLWICHHRGTQLQKLRRSWRKVCISFGLGKMVYDPERKKLVWQGKIPHDFRRTAVRNMLRAGVPEKIAMAISGHKTRSVFDRYNIVNEAYLRTAADRMNTYFEKERGTLTGTLAELATPSEAEPHSQDVDITGEELVPPTRIERATRGLGNLPTSTSDNLTPQETIKQDELEVGADGAGLSCPGSSVVADLDSSAHNK